MRHKMIIVSSILVVVICLWYMYFQHINKEIPCDFIANDYQGKNRYKVYEYDGDYFYWRAYFDWGAVGGSPSLYWIDGTHYGQCLLSTFGPVEAGKKNPFVCNFSWHAITSWMRESEFEQVRECLYKKL